MIYTLSTADEASHYDMHGAVAVVIDVLRATTTMTVALANGAKEILAVSTPSEALALRERLGDNVLLGGERNADKIQDFDLDNSPRSYTSQVVNGKTIVMTTTNGTRAIANASSASRLFIASFLNIDATARLLATCETDIYIICSGTEGHFTLEDGICAGMLLDLTCFYRSSTEALPKECNDFSHSMRALYLSTSDDVKRLASQGEHFGRLRRKGYGMDIDICFDMTKKLSLIECVEGKIVMI